MKLLATGLVILAITACDSAGGEPSPTSTGPMVAEALPAWRLAIAAASRRESIIPDRTVGADDAALSQRGGLTYWKGELYSGYVVAYHDGDVLASRSGYLNGRRSGTQTKWFPSGALRERREYEAGRKHGLHRAWWEDGSERSVAGFLHGRSHGEQTLRAPSGRLLERRHYTHGEEDGAQQSWTADGRLLANYVVKGGRRYGLLGARPCFTVRDGLQLFPGRERRDS